VKTNSTFLFFLGFKLFWDSSSKISWKSKRLALLKQLAFVISQPIKYHFGFPLEIFYFCKEVMVLFFAVNLETLQVVH
jgi:hypothetical protein